MIRIITAIGNPNLNNELRKYSEFDVVGKDIQYVEGIIESLEMDSNIDYIIVNGLLEEQLEIEYLIKKTIEINRKIKLIAIIDKKDEEIEKKLISKGIYEILYDGTEIYNIINLMKNKNIEKSNKELRAEIENLKKIISNKKDNKIIKKLKINDKKISKKNNKINNKKNNKIISVTGCRGIGKTTFAITLSNILQKKYKVLLVDFDIINSDISSVVTDFNFKENIKKINNNLDVFFNINYLIYKQKNNVKNIFSYIEKIKNNYDYIIIDNYSELIFDLNKYIFLMSDHILFLTGLNNLEIQKSKKYLEYILKKWNIEKNKINLIMYKYRFFNLIFFNKLNLNSIFKNIKIIGRINYDFYINLVSNIFPKNVILNIKNIINIILILKKINKKG